MYFSTLGGTSPSGGQAREERFTDHAPACPVLSLTALLQGLWLLQLHINTATFPNFQGVLLCQRKAWTFLAGHSTVSYSPDSTHSAQPEQEGIKLSSQHLV